MSDTAYKQCGAKRSRMVSIGHSLAMRTVRWYVRHTPVQKGKWRLIDLTHKLIRNDDSVVLSEVQPGIWMELDLNSFIERHIYYAGFYRPWVLPHFDRLLKRGQVVVDIGANVGQFSLWAAKKVAPTGIVLAFEPEPTSFAKLAKNVEINATGIVKFENMAIADFDGEAIFNFNAADHDNQGQGSLARLSCHRRTHRVRCLTLDTLIAERDIKQIDVLKIDTQGAEMRVLTGAKGVIERDRPAVLLRCHEDKCQEMQDATVDIQQFLLDKYYDLFKIVPWSTKLLPVTSPSQTEDSTFLAVHRT